MRRFILVDAFAAEELVSTRTLQSDDFENGRILGAALTGALCLGQLAPKAYLVEAGQGLYILNGSSKSEDVLVIDLEQAPLFEGCSTRDAILRFQKLLRFARRRWTKVGPAQNE